MSKSNKYGYSGVDIPTQASFNNVGKFDPNEINELVEKNKWTKWGQIELIETQVISSSTSNMTFSNIKQNEYNVHFLTYTSYGCPVDNKRLVMRFYENGVEESGSVYKFAGLNNRTDGAHQTTGTSSTNCHLGVNGDADANVRDNGYIYIYNAGDSTKYTYYSAHTAGMYQNTAKFGSLWIGGMLPQTSMVDQIKLMSSTESSNISSLTASLYGIKEY